MSRVRVLLVIVALATLAPATWGHGGSFRGPRGGVPPGLPSQPSKPGASGGSFHTWLTWWGYNQFNHIKFRKRQAERRGPVTGIKKEPEDPNAWRADVRARLTPLMMRAIEDTDEEVRTAACVALGKWQVKKATLQLRKMRTDDPIKQVREAALLGLVLMRDPLLRPHFIEIASSDKENLRMRGYALLGLGLSKDEQAKTYLLNLLDPKNKKARRAWPQSTKEQREFLICAVGALIQNGDPSLAKEFLRLTGEKRLPEEVRAMACSGIGKLGANALLPNVQQILKTSDSAHLRRSAAVACGVLATRQDTSAIKELGKRISKDKDRIVGHFATLSLGQIGGPDAFKLLRRYYPRANKESRGFFLIAFGLCGENDGAEYLKEALTKNKDARDRAAAALAFGLYQKKEHAPLVREKFGEAKDWLLMQSTMLALGILDDKQSAPGIKEVLITRKEPAVRTSAAMSYALLRQWSAIPVFVDLLETSRSIVTLSTISQVMGFLSSPRAVDPLVKVVENDKLQRQARAFALVALGSLGDPEEIPLLVRMAFDMNYMLRSDPFDEAITIL
ncbi:MAG: HEAT repeat domain-containing protein [Planctomycetota bacterium]|nr:HEAT repeat domain-containing protein [Planctomycetota bacterium]